MVEHEYKNYSWSVIVHSKQLDSKKRSDRHKSSERSHNLDKILYLILDYPHKHYTFKHFEV